MTSGAKGSEKGLFGWWRDGTPAGRRALIAAGLGWMLDSFDVMLYALVLASIAATFLIGFVAKMVMLSH